jgi:hypothetical protein
MAAPSGRPKSPCAINARPTAARVPVRAIGSQDPQRSVSLPRRCRFPLIPTNQFAFFTLPSSPDAPASSSNPWSPITWGNVRCICRHGVACVACARVCIWDVGRGVADDPCPPLALGLLVAAPGSLLPRHRRVAGGCWGTRPSSAFVTLAEPAAASRWQAQVMGQPRRGSQG